MCVSGPAYHRDVVRTSWDVLTAVPVNKQLEKAMRSALAIAPVAGAKPGAALNWSSLLPPYSAAQLLYGLRLLDHFLRQREFETKDMQAWRESNAQRFYETQGFGHLVRLLLCGLPLEDHKGPELFLLRNEAVGALLRLLCAHPKYTVAVIPSVHRPAVVQRVLVCSAMVEDWCGLLA